MNLLLDTTVLIDYLRGRPVADRIDRHLSAGDDLATTGINVEEVARGLLPGEEIGAGRLFDGLTVVPLGRAEGWRAGRWRRQFSTRGITLSQADCLIAAAALSVDARLVTGNPADFPMEGLVVEHWPVGE